MKESNLLASVALFSQLYNNKNYSDISDTLAEFIKSAISIERAAQYTIHDLTILLEKHFDFDIPDAIVKTTVKSRLKKFFKRQGGFYIFDSSIFSSSIVGDAFSQIKQAQQNIISTLVDFIEKRKNNILDEKERANLIRSLIMYLLDTSISEDYYQSISAFIIKNSLNGDFQRNLNLIKEGIVLYQGIRYTADINERGKWKTDLKIFLATEHLFNAVGLNGIIFKEIFDDFYGLVTEINGSGKNRFNDNFIELHYLEETKDEIDAFFVSAERIIEGRGTIDYSRSAMRLILEGCKYPSDVREKRTKLFRSLENLGITYQEFPHSVYSYQDFNVEDDDIISSIGQELTQRGWHFDENRCREIFRMFTKINYYRGGTNKAKFENIGAILITANSLALYSAHQQKVKFEDKDIPYAKDIEFITTKFWFKLKKGFNENSSLPRSFDVISKAQVVLSGQLSASVYQKYENLKSDIKKGNITRDDALQMSYDFRQKSLLPEDININNVDDALDFLNDENYYERIMQEKVRNEQALKDTTQERDALLAKIDRLQKIEINRDLELEKKSFNERRDVFVHKELKQIIKDNKMACRYFILVLSLNLILAIISVIVSVSKDVKDYLGAFTTPLAVGIVVLFIVLIVIELLGRSYIFNKEKVKIGYNWLVTVIQRRKYRQFIDEKNQLLTSDYGNFRHEVQGD